MSQNGRHGCLCRNIRRSAMIGIAGWSLLILGNNSFEFFFGKIKNLGRQSFVRINISIQRGIPNIGSDILIIVVSTIGLDFVVRIDWNRLLLRSLTTFFVVACFSILFSMPFLSFDVSVSLANELCQNHVKSFVSAPCPCQMPKGCARYARQYQYFHPHQLSFPSLQLSGWIVDRKHSPRPSFFVSVPGWRLEIIKTFLQMYNQWQFAGVVCFFVLYKIQRLGQNLVVYGKSLGGWRNVCVFYLWNGSRHAFHGLKVSLAHLVKVSLGLFRAALDFAGLWFGTVPLAEALRFDNGVASLDPAVPAFVF